MATVRELAPGITVSQSALWQTNSLLVTGETESLLVDPAYAPSEIEALAARARGSAAVSVLITHADFDHVCGIGLLPEATVVAGADTAGAIRSGTAGEQLAAAGANWGHDWPTTLRVDAEIGPGRHTVGEFAVDAIAAPGHTADGLAFLLPDQRVLAPGDYLSSITYPFVTSGVGRAAATCRALLATLESHDVAWVVPGHGPALETNEARAIAAADIAYLDCLLAAAEETRQRGLPPGPALLHVFNVSPPRPTTPDFEVYGIHAANARAALEEARAGV